MTGEGTQTLSLPWLLLAQRHFAENKFRASVAPNASCTVLIAFKSTAAGARTGLLTIVDDAISGEAVIALSGTATTPILTIAPASGATNTATVTAG